MGLSRLDNFLKSARGTILYVNPNDLDATDSIENQGNSLTRPFKTIQRALIESARFSYQRGLNNDRFGKTTILVYPGEHLIDNRPGWIPDGLGNFRLRNGTTSSSLSPFDSTSNFDLESPNNDLYKLNSIHGGVIVPRGTSIVGLDLRKTKIRPKYVPNPVNNNIERSAIFRVTGSCYFWQFSIFDADPNGVVFKDYTLNTFVPNFSHHKLTCFEYADGKNSVSISDDFQVYSTTRTDLDMYYEKVGIVYGPASGRSIEPDYPSASLDIQPKIDEFRIVGATGGSVGISSIKAGNGIESSTVITVTTEETLTGLDVDTPFRVEGISASGYNGQFVVNERLSNNQITYNVQNPPVETLPPVAGSTLSLSSDTVTGASPYIFNVSLRSVFGMCGLHADGSKSTGFKSMVVAQFTGIGLQKDDNAFVLFNSNSGTYEDASSPGNETLSNNSRAVFKPEYKNFHIKATNSSFIQNVSCFAIGFAEHFVVESGGDMSITNSNSNFGAKALVASGFKTTAFNQDDLGYITHIIPPKEISPVETAIEFNAIDTERTVGVASTAHLYLYNQTNPDVAPQNIVDGYRIGARENDQLNVLLSSAGTVTQHSSRIVMPGSESSSEKSFAVATNASNILTFDGPHTLLSGESIRIQGSTGQIPDGLENNRVYFAITDDTDTGLSSSQIKIAKTQNDALSHQVASPNNLTFNTLGTELKVISRVSDKNSGDIGHPIQFDSTNSQWYIKVATASTENTIYPNIIGIGFTDLGPSTPRTFINRKSDSRNAVDTVYRLRYVIPKDTGGVTARPPVEGFIVQESGSSIGSSNTEIQTYFGTGSLTNESQQRNFKLIANASWSASTTTITTELPHELSVGSQVEILNITSTSNTSGDPNSGFNGTFTVTQIGNSKEFSVTLTTDPGTFTNNTSQRNTSLPYFKRKQYKNIYYVYRDQEVRPYVPGEQDGVYYMSVVNASNSPTATPFTEEKFSQPVREFYPQTNRDDPKSDPEASVSFASNSLVGEVVVDDNKNSITRETINKKISEGYVGVGLTDIVSESSSNHIVSTSIDHGLNRVTQVNIVSNGSGYGSGGGSAEELYNATLVGLAGSTTGSHATAKVSVDASGTVTDVVIMDGGSAYGIGNTMKITGVTTFGTYGGGTYSDAVVEVTQIYDNTGDTVKIVGVKSEAYSPFNDLYRITDVNIGAAKSFSVESASSVGVGTTTGIGAATLTDAFVYLTGESVRINSFTYNHQTGIATVLSENKHGLRVDNVVRIVGANESIYNGDFPVTEIVGSGGTSFELNLGIGTYSPAATGTLYGYRRGITSNQGNITENKENIDGRMNAVYAGITTTLNFSIANPTTDSISLLNLSTLDLKIGDYLEVGSEVMRIKTTISDPPTNPVEVFRGVLGSKATSHPVNSVVRKIKVKPIELRRHSISRASGHTFEYVGFGPGNYSTAFPDKQDRQISAQEELLAQSTKREGGINFYTGMNDRGISYAGNKKLSTITGKEEIFDTPVQTITGEDISILKGINVISPIEGLFTRSVKVEGGDDGTAMSEFNGPVIFNNKITSTSDKGIESNSLFIQGDTTISRKYTVGISTPSVAGNPGDVVYFADPSKGGYAGWIYTVDNDWHRFGSVSLSKDFDIGIFDQVGIATTSPGDCKLKVGSGTSLFCVDADGVGIGTTANGYALHVIGETNFGGSVYISAGSTINGDGSGLTNINGNAFGWTNITGGIFNTYLNSVGIGTSVPRHYLEVGYVGMGTTSMEVNGEAKFAGIINTNDLNVSGVATASGFDLQSSSGRITAGIVTSTDLVVGSAGTVITTSSVNVGIGSTIPSAKLDVEGLSRFKTISRSNLSPSSVLGVLTLDLSQSQIFEVTLTENITQITIENAPSDCSEFTIKFTQDASTTYTVDFDDIRDNDGAALGIHWPGGGLLPIMTPTASRSDIYGYKTFDSGSNWYGFVVGQNFL